MGRTNSVLKALYHEYPTSNPHTTLPSMKFPETVLLLNVTFNPAHKQPFR